MLRGVSGPGPPAQTIPQYRRPIGARSGEDFQGRRMTGVGVVSVVQNGDILPVMHIHPHLGGTKAQSPPSSPPRHAEPLPNGAAMHRVDSCAAQRGHGHRKVVLRGNHPAAQPLGPNAVGFPSPHRGRSVRPANTTWERVLPPEGEHGVVPVENRHPLRVIVENFLLRLQMPARLPSSQCGRRRCW